MWGYKCKRDELHVCVCEASPGGRQTRVRGCFRCPEGVLWPAVRGRQVEVGGEASRRRLPSALASQSCWLSANPFPPLPPLMNICPTCSWSSGRPARDCIFPAFPAATWLNSGHIIWAEVMCAASGNAPEMKGALSFSNSCCLESRPGGDTWSSHLTPQNGSSGVKVAEEKDRMNWKQYCAAELPGQPKTCRKTKILSSISYRYFISVRIAGPIY